MVLFWLVGSPTRNLPVAKRASAPTAFRRHLILHADLELCGATPGRRLPGRTSTTPLSSPPALLKGCRARRVRRRLEGRIDEGVVDEGVPARRVVEQARLDALPLGRADVAEEGAADRVGGRHETGCRRRCGSRRSRPSRQDTAEIFVGLRDAAADTASTCAPRPASRRVATKKLVSEQGASGSAQESSAGVGARLASV